LSNEIDKEKLIEQKIMKMEEEEDSSQDEEEEADEKSSSLSGSVKVVSVRPASRTRENLERTVEFGRSQALQSETSQVDEVEKLKFITVKS
jgi:hypothetical protein